MAPAASYMFMQADADLRPFIDGLVDIRLDARAGAALPVTRPPPEPSLGLMFHYGERVGVRVLDGPELQLRSHLTGVHDVSHSVRARGAGGILTVGLTPRGAAAFQGGPMRLFARSRVALDEVFPPAWVAGVEEQIEAAPDGAARMACVQLAMRRLLVPHACGDNLVAWAADSIRKSNGVFSLEPLARGAGIGARQLERVFKAEYGIGPKRFGRIVRLRHALQLMSSPCSVSAVAAEAGYSDQPHFTREVRAMMGTTPAGVQGMAWACASRGNEGVLLRCPFEAAG